MEAVGRRLWGLWRWSLLIAACATVFAAWSSSSGAVSTARHRGKPTSRRVCKSVKIGHGKHRHRFHFCVRILPVHHGRLVVHTHSGGFTPPPPGTDVPNEPGEAARIPIGPTRPLLSPPTVRQIVGVVAPTAGTNALPPSGPVDISIAATQLLTPDETPFRKTDTLGAEEPSVADAGRLVMYAFNWDAAYSKDGGRTWSELDPHSVFPAAASGGFGCDQVVQYDPTTKVFIWALQYQCGNTDVNNIRIAWASATRLEQLGAKAWSWFDFDPNVIAGKKNAWLDQPRLGFTPAFLYISLNQGVINTDSHGNKSAKLEHAAVIRIPRSAFTSTGGSPPFGYALLDPKSLRVAQNVQGSREFFVSNDGNSQLTVAWVDDNSNYINSQIVKSPTIATKDWTSTTPGGEDMLLHQAGAQGTQVTGVTQGGDGTLWAAWTEARQLPNGTAKYAQSHIGVAELQPIPGHVGFTLGAQHEYENPSFTYSLPDLATDASGEVGFDVVWGGGGLYYANHAVGLLYPRDHRSNAFEPVADALASSDNVQVGGLAGDPVGDYETIRPMAPPYGDCFVAAGVVNRKDSSGNMVGYPVFTIFSRPGVKCPPGFRSLPIVGLPPLGNAPPPPPPPPARGTSLTLTCPTNGTVGTPITLSGALTPSFASRMVTITVTGAASTNFSVSTLGDASYSSTYTPSAAGQYTFVASYAGESGFSASSSQPCTVNVSAAPPQNTAVSLTCPTANPTPGSPFSLSGSLTPALVGRTITIIASGPASTSVSTTTQADGSYSATTSLPKDGQYTLVANYPGEPGYLPSSSAPCTVTVITP
jgi:hypothetical protein